MSKRQRNILIAGTLLVIVLLSGGIAIVGSGSPFDSARVAGQLIGGNVRQLLFGDTALLLEELSTNCDRLSQGILDLESDCRIRVEGSDEPVNFDTPRDLRLTTCWGTVITSVDNDAGKIEIDEVSIPTERNAESLTVNIFEEGDTEVDLACDTDQCVLALNDTACPPQTAIAPRNMQFSAGCNLLDGVRLTFQTGCTITIDTTGSASDEDEPNPIAFDEDDRPRIVPVTYCAGDIAFSAASREDNFIVYDVIALPDDTRQRAVDIYGQDITTLQLSCVAPPDETNSQATRPACRVTLSDGDCFP